MNEKFPPPAPVIRANGPQKLSFYLYRAASDENYNLGALSGGRLPTEAQCPLHPAYTDHAYSSQRPAHGILMCTVTLIM